jgi:peptidoglycan biosynthesis protein MviN/MurJ (putative lipid II flippase)
LEQASRSPAGHESLKLSLLLGITTAAQLLASVGMQWFAIASLGASTETDALLAGMTLPLLCITLGAESLTFVLTPLFATKSESVRGTETWHLLVAVGAISAAAAVTLGLAAPVLIPFLTPGFGPEARALTLTLTRIQLGAVVGATWYGILAGLCHARGQFLRVPLAALACLVAAWAVLFWRLHTDGVLLVAWMQVVVYVGPPLLLLSAAGPPKIAHRWPPELSLVWHRLRPVLLAASYGRTGFVVDRCLASFAGPGSLVILDVGQRVQGAAARIMNDALVTPHVPMLARIAADHQWDHFKAVCRHQRRRVAVAASAVAGIIVVASVAGLPWLGVIAPSAAIGETLRRLAPVLGCLSGIALTASLSHSLTAAFYAMGDTDTPSRIGAAMYTVGLGAKVVGAASSGLQGLALAITASHVCNWLVLEYAWARAFRTPFHGDRRDGDRRDIKRTRCSLL